MFFTGIGKVDDLGARPVFSGKGEVDIRAIKALQKDRRRVTVEQFFHDFNAGFFVGGGGERGERHVEVTAQIAYAQIIRAKIVAPLGHTMRFIYGDHADTSLAQHPLCAVRGEAFRRHVEQFKGAVFEVAPNLVGFFLGVAAGQRPRDDARFFQPAHLVTHQRDEGGNDDGNAVTHQRRQLETQGFAATRGHDGKGVFAVCDCLNDLLLARTVTVKAENVAEKRGSAHACNPVFGVPDWAQRITGGRLGQALDEGTSVIIKDDADGLNCQQCDQRCKVNAAHLRHDAADRAIDRFQQAAETVPDLRHELLANVENLKLDQPRHDEMRDNEEANNIEDHQQDLEKRLHRAFLGLGIRTIAGEVSTQA